jgi:cohesin loading factor subunit SCC2
MCVVVQYLTHDFVRLVNLLKSCNGRSSYTHGSGVHITQKIFNIAGRLQQMVKRPASQEMNPAEIRALIILIFIVSLLAENCNFDTLRKENPSALIPINSLDRSNGL